MHLAGVEKLAANLKAADPFKPPAEPARPSGGETYRGGGGIPPKYQAPAPYQAPPGPASHLQSAHPAHPSNQQSGLDPRDFMPVSSCIENIYCNDSCCGIARHSYLFRSWFS